MRKITADDLLGKGVVGLSDTPGLSKEEMQRRFDEIAKEVIIPAFNEVVEELSGNSGAGSIGVVPPETLPEADTMQKAVDQLAEQVKTQGENLDNAITEQGESLSKAITEQGQSLGQDIENLENDFGTALDEQDAALRQYVDDTLQAIGAADMLSTVYDPQGKKQDIFAFAEDAAETAAGDAKTAAESTADTLVTNHAAKPLHIVTLACKKSGTVFQLTGLSGKSGVFACMFSAPAAYSAGNTFTVDGVSYTLKLQNGETAESNLFASGVLVSCIIDTAGKTVNFKAGGGLSASKLALATATADKVIAPYTFYAGNKTLKTGTALPLEKHTIEYTTASYSANYTDTLTLEAVPQMVTVIIDGDFVGALVEEGETIITKHVKMATVVSSPGTMTWSGRTITIVSSSADIRNKPAVLTWM